MSWTHALCERCWVTAPLRSQPVIPVRPGDPRAFFAFAEGILEVAEDGGLAFREPVRLTDAGAAFCCHCGFPTWLGLFVRAHASLMPFCTGHDEGRDDG